MEFAHQILASVCPQLRPRILPATWPEPSSGPTWGGIMHHASHQLGLTYTFTPHFLHPGSLTVSAPTVCVLPFLSLSSPSKAECIPASGCHELLSALGLSRFVLTTPYMVRAFTQYSTGEAMFRNG